MLAVLISWGILSLVFWTFGHSFHHWYGVARASPAAKLISGLVVVTFIFTLGSFFCSTELISIGVFAVTLVLLWCFKSNFRIDVFSSLSFIKKPLFVILALVTAYLATQTPTIIDHNSYYWQTIEWFKTYGAVNGLGNLHPFYAQASIWHVLQSGLTLSFIGLNLQTINGWLVLVVGLYFLEQHQQSKLSFTAVYVLFLPFVLLFVDSASPDLPSLVLVPVIVQAFFTHQFSKRHVLYLLFLVLVKITIAPFLILVLFAKTPFKLIKNTLLPSLLMVGVWVCKNYIVSGFLLYPITWSPIEPDWQMNSEIVNFLVDVTKRYGYTKQIEMITDLNLWQRITIWLQLGGINRLMNWSMIGLCLLVPFTPSFRRHAQLRFLYLALLLVFIATLISSPQYRFFLIVWMCFAVIVLNDLRKIIPFKIPSAVFKIAIVVLCIPVILFNIPQSHLRKSLSWFEIMVINSRDQEPLENYKTFQVGNLKFNSPKHSARFYQLGQIPLPAVDVQMLKVYQHSFYVVPQLRDSVYLYKGFKSEPALKFNLIDFDKPKKGEGDFYNNF